MGKDPHKISEAEKAKAALLLLTDIELPSSSAEADPDSLRQTLRDPVKLLKHPFTLLLIGTTISLLLVPTISSWLNEARLKDEVRQKKILEFGDRDTEFNNKTNVLRTMIITFGERPFSLKNQPAQLKTERSAFKKTYADRYAALDEMAWWWYGNTEREANVLKLAPPAQLSQLHKEIRAYNTSTKATVEALDKVREHISSEDLSLDERSHEQYTSKKIRMTWEIVKQREIRRELAGRIGVILAATERPYLGNFEITLNEGNTPTTFDYKLTVTNFGEAEARIVRVKLESSLCDEPLEAIVSKIPSGIGSRDTLQVEGSVSPLPGYDNINTAITKLGADFKIKIEIYYRKWFGEEYFFSSTATYDMECKCFVVVDGQSN